MRRKKNEKQYIFTRDNRTCRFCGKELISRQISLDHYLPKSKGGPDDSFNLVLSCKKCNRMKKSSVPDDYGEVMVFLFKKAVYDEKIVGAGLKLKQKELEDLVEDIHRIEDIGKYTVFQSSSHRFYVKNNKIYTVVKVDTKL